MYGMLGDASVPWNALWEVPNTCQLFCLLFDIWEARNHQLICDHSTKSERGHLDYLWDLTHGQVVRFGGWLWVSPKNKSNNWKNNNNTFEWNAVYHALVFEEQPVALQLTWAESEAICAQILEGGLRALRLWQWARFSCVLLVTWNLLMERQCFPSIVFWRVKSKNDTFFFQVVKLCVSSAHSHTLTSTTKQILNFPEAMSAKS